ncbi:hypothetical protein CKN73_04995 [Carnobacterium divergens]|uniref:Uncharacterized protein n=1 Tax=Carnobacterium divergens DSM 20623 TaxID=1449336 RepID=A0A0R2I499_CARDV|nr:hypothetical protein [Carnobacterium divergens]KRN56660.1 hypothetical protein IV74_GL000908 [Carnobacterium divergens DSM 20623]MDO0875512.1 hypothetical protein [Carnobacterium divergens]MDT2012318.1 hypothetical protein [Carnobacterium divergens]TFJ41818.1 hypothetical protein CKN77_05120 [Carnobacterium divergens]TFJ50717.1 hypothetical protein CKN73_04995 [Carnobacterium divergens]
MTIEQYWNDVTIYYVVFQTHTNLEISKTLVFPTEWSQEKVKTSISNCFNNVKKIIVIEEDAEGLALKL